jgi:hypothetical protein
MVLLVAGVALWSATQIRDTPMDHDLFWLSGVGALGLAAIVAAAIDWFSPRMSASALGRCAAVATMAVCAGFGIARLFHVAGQSNVPPDDVAAIRKASGASLHFLQQHRLARPLVVIDQDVWPYAVAVLLEFEKHGQPFSVETDWLPMFTDDAALNGREDGAMAIAGARRHLVERERPGDTIIAEAPPIFVDAAPPR